MGETELRKVYEASGSLMSHFDNVPASAEVERYENGKPIPSLANLLRLHRPIVIVDEAQNVRSTLSFETLARFNPACILEFTATPHREDHPSTVLYSISARELKAESMIKLPLRLETRPNWKELIGDAILKLKELEGYADAERAQTGEYLRPIMLLQAQPLRTGKQTVSVEVVEALSDRGLQHPSRTDRPRHRQGRRHCRYRPNRARLQNPLHHYRPKTA